MVSNFEEKTKLSRCPTGLCAPSRRPGPGRRELNKLGKSAARFLVVHRECFPCRLAGRSQSQKLREVGASVGNLYEPRGENYVVGVARRGRPRRRRRVHHKKRRRGGRRCFKGWFAHVADFRFEIDDGCACLIRKYKVPVPVLTLDCRTSTRGGLEPSRDLYICLGC